VKWLTVRNPTLCEISVIECSCVLNSATALSAR
jgi:hypothetical protein